VSNNTLKKRIDDDGNRIIEVYEGDLNEMQHQIDKLKWISVDDRLPEPEQAVLAAVNGLDAPIVLGLRWECCNPMIEGYFKDFLYWDDPNNDGQDFGDRVSHWMPCPDMPQLTNINDNGRE